MTLLILYNPILLDSPADSIPQAANKSRCGLPAGAQVFKTMNQVGFWLMDHPSLNTASKPVMFVAGDGAGKSEVLQLVADLGFEAIDVAGLEFAPLLEPLAMLWIYVALFRRQGLDFAFGLLRK